MRISDALGSVIAAAAAAAALPAVSFGQNDGATPDGGRSGPAAVQEIRHEHEEAGPAWPSGEHATGEWFGLRQRLRDQGVTFEAYLVADLSLNFRGGLDTGSEAFRHLFDANVTFDTEPLFGWKGGRLFLDFQNQNGRNGSALLIGDFQVFSNIDEEGFTALYELWYEQRLLDDRLRLKVGKVDANSEFAFVEYGADFIHSSPGYSPTILGFPTYPDPAASVNFFVNPADGFYAGAGVYDGATQEGRATGTRGPKTFLGSPSDLFLIGEAGVKWALGGARDGRLGVGVFHHTGTFDKVDGGDGTEDGTTGAYLVLDQRLLKEDPADPDNEEGIGAFLQVGYADEDVADADLHVGLGAAWTGAIPGRGEDVVGVMASYVHFSDAARAAGAFDEDYELAVEAFYKIRLTRWLIVKPDVQYIVNPGGGEADDALVGTLRLEVAF